MNPDFQEAAHFDACFFHFLIELLGDMPTAHVVVQQPYFHAFFCFVCQHVAYEAAHCVVFEDVVFQVDMVAGFVQFLYQGDDFFFS